MAAGTGLCHSRLRRRTQAINTFLKPLRGLSAQSDHPIWVERPTPLSCDSAVICHGETAWSAQRSVEELTGVLRELLDCSVRFSFPLLDLGQVPDESLATDPCFQSILNLLKYGRRRDLADRWERIFQ
jgi:hypothetical protein